MLSRIPSVKDAYFQHKVLSKIHGKPTYESLQNVLTELKANASSVPSTLGVGNNGHLGLLLSDPRYTTLANTIPWITPVNPGPFVPPAAGTGPQIEAERDVWRELKQTFELCQATEKALIVQVIEAIDPIYLQAMLNRATGQYSSSIRALLLHLFETYGKITPQQVKAKEMELYNMHYNISQPVNTVFNSIDNLSELTDHADSPMTAQQMIYLAYVIFAKHPILQQDLRLWNRRPAADCTWGNMMQHMREAQVNLSYLPSADDVYHQQPSAAHEANVTTMADLVAQRLLDDTMYNKKMNPAYFPNAPPPPPAPAPAPLYDDVANSLQRRETELQSRETAMMSQMQVMMRTMMLSNTQARGTNPSPRASDHPHTCNAQQHQTHHRGARHTQGRGRGCNNSCTNTNSTPRSYCWTHGACAHHINGCNTPATGHQKTASFDNMQGGSTNGCYWLN
jgi:hypothetical protein